jgi:hypothetical protein
MTAPFTGPLAELPEHLPGEPPTRRRSGAALWPPAIVGLALSFTLLVALGPLWLPYALLARVYGRPPSVPRAWQVNRYLRLIWTAQAPHPGISLARRVHLTGALLRKLAMSPLWGLAWLLDEVLYGRALSAVSVHKPLFEISAGRSGSTQLAHHLEDDPTLVAPNLLQSLFPYLWLWKLVPVTIGRLVSEDTVRSKLVGMLSPAFVERHELDPFRTDTFDGALFTAHLNELAIQLGPDVAADDLAMGHVAPHNRPLWGHDFPAMIGRIGRKVLLFHGAGRRLFIKGHFLAAAPALALQFPDARFLTVIRTPSKRLQSAINYMRVNPADPVLGPPPWSWLVEAIVRTEQRYNAEELAWYTAPGPTARCVIRFDDYVRDLGGTLDTVYSQCMDGPPPPSLPREHPPRRRTNYQVDRSLEALRVDGAAFDAAQGEYLRWCRG